MIDDERDVRELIQTLTEYLPMAAYATPRLVKAVGRSEPGIRVNDTVKIDSLLYLGDAGGIACAIELRAGKHVVITSLTHLRIDPNHPLAEKIEAYQKRRSQRLAATTSRGPRGPGANRHGKSEAKMKHSAAAGRLQCQLRFWLTGDRQTTVLASPVNKSGRST
ncbi:MAG TPA: hypothetical protein VG125_06355 [Pirellulales bacterium]|nr:hypothetical protein [Pirellulales bacterium]